MNSNDGITGRGVLQFAHNTLDICGFTDKATKEYFKNGMTVQGIIKSPNRNVSESERKKIRTGWMNTEGGLRLLEGGLEF